jgi:hypothetical protein
MYLCTSENNLARHKNEQYNFGLLHSINQSWKQLRFILHTTHIPNPQEQGTKELG